MLSRQLWYLTDSLRQLDEKIQVGAMGIDEGDLVGTEEHWVTTQGKETGQVCTGDWACYTFLHNRAGTFTSLLYKAGMPSVHLSSFDVTPLSWLGSTQDFIYVIAVASGTSKLVFISL